MDELEDDTVALMRKRVYDMAGVLGKVEVWVRLPHAHPVQPRQCSSSAVAQFITKTSADDVRAAHGMVQVYWNGTKVPVKDFKAYCGLYLGPDPKVHGTSNFSTKVAWQLSASVCLPAHLQLVPMCVFL